MTIFSFASFSLGSMAFSVIAHLTVGILLGLLYFRSLWWNVRLFTSGGHVTTTIVLFLGRFAVLGGLLALASLEGALPLLSMVFGLLIARAMVVRRIREAAP